MSQSSLLFVCQTSRWTTNMMTSSEYVHPSTNSFCLNAAECLDLSGKQKDDLLKSRSEFSMSTHTHIHTRSYIKMTSHLFVKHLFLCANLNTSGWIKTTFWLKQLKMKSHRHGCWRLLPWRQLLVSMHATRNASCVQSDLRSASEDEEAPGRHFLTLVTWSGEQEVSSPVSPAACLSF